jgi:hypothetical protein
MGAKAAIAAYAKSGTIWAGVLQWLLNGVLILMVSGKRHSFDFGLDGDLSWSVPLTTPVLFAVASACLGLLAYRRNKATGPLYVALGQVAQAIQANQPAPEAQAPEGAKSCAVPPPSF